MENGALGDEELKMGVALKGQQGGSLRWWNSSVFL